MHLLGYHRLDAQEDCELHHAIVLPMPTPTALQAAIYECTVTRAGNEWSCTSY